MERSSRLSGFFQLTSQERARRVQEFAGLSGEELSLLGDGSSLGLAQAEHMIENVVGIYDLPLGIATNLRVNGRD